MKGHKLIGLLLLLTTGTNSPGWGAFSSLGTVAISASATVGAGPSLSIQATPLPVSAFFGKNVIIPVKVISRPGPINPKNLSVTIEYQLFNGGTQLTPPVGIPITFSADPTNNAALIGSAIIPSSELQPIKNGGRLYYVFVARQGLAGVMLNASQTAPAPNNFTDLSTIGAFATDITAQVCSPVGPAGALVSAPDLFVHDGQTAVSFAQGALLSPGTFCITQNDTSGWPQGPGGNKPAAVYSFTLNGTSLVQTAMLVVSYPSDVNGGVLNLNANPNDLAIYWLGPEGLPSSDQSWHVLSRPQIDTTLHTVTGTTSHFSTYALFATGATSNADLRPAQRIITPNGDGKNDTAIFGGGIDEVKIFDIRGRRVKSIAGPSPVWDGTNDSGSIVESGVYLYQFTVNGDRVSGVIGVAK